MNMQITKPYYHFHNIKGAHLSILQETKCMIRYVFIANHYVDYCNNLMISVPKSLDKKLRFKTHQAG